MRILGIDPGVATIGFGLIESGSGVLRMLQYGTITTPAGQPMPQRLRCTTRRSPAALRKTTAALPPT